MNDLDQRLAEVFDRRAELAPPVLTPAVVRRAVHQHRVRGAKATAGAVLACCGLMVASAVRGGAHDGGRPPVVSAPMQPPAPTAAGDFHGTIVEELAWTATTPLTLLRGGVGAPEARPTDGYAFCFGASCMGQITVSRHGFTLGDDRGSIFGLAPHGTRTVVVTVGHDAPVSIPVSPTDDPTLPGVLYGTSEITPVAPGPGAFSLSYRLTAYDWEGDPLDSQLVVGSFDLARQHVPVGVLAALPADVGAGPKQVAWTDRLGWACWGEQAGSGAGVSFGANVCVPPQDPGKVTLVAESPSFQSVVLRVPATVTRCELRSQGGRVVKAAFTDTGHGRLATFDLTVGVPSANSRVTCWDPSGKELVSAPMNSFTTPAGAVEAP
jgi:hypothetical protein